MPRPIFGELSGVPVGSTFQDRTELTRRGVHRHLQAGIAGTESDGADSVVISGGYEDDEDLGDVLIYTGFGGRDNESGQQAQDQHLNRWNLALARSCLEGLPVRVIRGAGSRTPFAPSVGYRYDGLFRVEGFWRERGRSGHLVIRYRLVKLEHGAAPSYRAIAEEGASPPRTPTLVQRIVRNSETAQRVKQLHEYVCQACGGRIETPAGHYAEAAHIRPLGEPHNGADELENLLCLCPNDHVRFDLGAIVVTDDLLILAPSTGAVIGALRTNPAHRPARQHLAYHRRLWTGEAT